MSKAKRQKANGMTPPYDKQKMFQFYLGSVANIRRDWDALAHLFLDRRRRDYLNRVVPVLADAVNTLLTQSIYMGLAQLFDPLETFGDRTKSNLVLRRVIDDLAPPRGDRNRSQIEADYQAIEPTVKLIKRWRHAVGAHRDLQTTIALVDYMASGYKQRHPLPHIPLMQLRGALQRLVNISDVLDAHIFGAFRVWYEPAVVMEIETIFAALHLDDQGQATGHVL